MQAPLVHKLLSGGQTGVDRAALDWALQRGVPCGGWCPHGRRAEDGAIDARYPLTETPGRDYPQRTEWNVRDADGTLILVPGKPEGGTLFTMECARRLGKPLRLVDLQRELDVAGFRHWLRRRDIRILNVAGPRESKFPGIGRRAGLALARLLAGAGQRSQR
jgi:hypothetical protein